MEEQISNFDQSADTTGSEIYLGTDLFDEVIRSLAKVYFRLWSIEKMKKELNSKLVKGYYRRYKQVLTLKKRFSTSAKIRRDKATDTYEQELKIARTILLREADL